MSRYFAWLHRVFVAGASLLLFFSSFSTASAATCSITSATVINQAYVTANSCTAIEINGNVSTTWIGTVDLGGGTVTVKSGYTMTMGSSSQMVLGANDDFVVESNATTTHLAEETNGLQISARNVTVSGKINADAKGCRGGRGSNQNGFGPHASTGICTSNTTGAGKTGGGGGGGGSGGTHGGLGSAGLGGGGATTTYLYGNSLEPTFLGSGGGQGYFDFAYGGQGGGRIALIATGVLTINGSISAGGANGTIGNFPYHGGGAGSGGSIAITAATLAGSGSVTAAGGIGGAGTGAGGNGGGHGGGGRVAVRYGASSFSLSSISASGGVKSGWTSGENGSTYILDRVSDDGSGTLTLTSGFDFPFAGDYTRDAISVSSGAFLRCPYAATSTSLTISSAAWITLPNVRWECNAGITQFTLSSEQGLSTTSVTMSFGSTTSVRIDVPAWTNVTTTMSNAYASGEVAVDVDTSVEFRGFSFSGPSVASTLVATGTFFTLTAGENVTLISSTISSNVSSTVAGSFSMDAASTINANGRGCLRGTNGNNGYGPHATTKVCTITTTGYGKGGGGGGAAGGGAAHGGAGGRGESSANGQATTYGSSTDPSFFGSGGGSGYDYFNDLRGEGGNGGGVVRLRVGGAATVSGSITVNGVAGNNEAGYGYGGGGGGSGGSIYLYVGSLSGNGSLSAVGGAGGLGGSGGTSHDAGGGAGGRIAIYYSSQSGTVFSGASVTGGTVGAGATAGASGSLYTFQTNIAPDAPGSLGSLTLANGSTTGTVTPIFTFALSDGDVSDTVKFQIQIDNSADFGSLVIDYTSALAAQGSTSFQVGQSAGSGAYAAGTSGQSLSDGSYYWRVKTIDANAAESSYTTANSGAVAFIVDSATRTISFQLSSGSGAESITATSIRITLDTTHFEDVTVNYAVSSTLTTASGSGEDYTLASGTATIEAGQTSTTVSLAVIDDAIDELNEVVGIELSSPTFASLGVTNSYAYTIIDNDTAGVTASESTRSVTEGGSSQTLTYVLDTAPTSTVLLAFTTSTAGITVTPMTMSFTSDNWSTPQTLTILATDDSRYESTHTTSVLFTVSGSVYGYPDISPPSVVVTITDNDTSSITLSASSFTIQEGASAGLALALTSQPTSTVSLGFTVPNQLRVSPSTITFTDSNWDTAQTLTITPVDDDRYAGTRADSFSISVTSLTAFASAELPSVTVTITDNEFAPIGGGGAGAGAAIALPIPFTPPVGSGPQSPSFSVPSPTAEVNARVEADLRAFKVKAAEAERARITTFIRFGSGPASQALGEGERRALVRDALETMRRADIPLADLERMAQGEVPLTRSITEERKQVARALPTFQTIFGRAPNFKNPQENLAWNTLLYRIRFPRDLTAERRGITEFKRLFGRNPTDPFQWAVVRVLGYIQR